MKRSSIELHITGEMEKGGDMPPATIDVRRDGQFVFAFTTKWEGEENIATGIAFGTAYPNVLEAMFCFIVNQFGEKTVINAWDKAISKMAAKESHRDDDAVK